LKIDFIGNISDLVVITVFYVDNANWFHMSGYKLYKYFTHLPYASWGNSYFMQQWTDFGKRCSLWVSAEAISEESKMLHSRRRDSSFLPIFLVTLARNKTMLKCSINLQIDITL
jgi:hypothetical protein